MDKENTKHYAHTLGLGSSRLLALNRLYNLERLKTKSYIMPIVILWMNILH